MIRYRLLLLLLAVVAGPGFAADAPFAQPRPGLYTGGQPDAAQLRQAAASGIRTVIDLRQPGEDRGFDETAVADELGLRYLRLPIAGAAGLTVANAGTLERLLAQAEGPVLLHCASGNRAGALLALINARGEGASVDQALELGRRAGMTSLEPVVRALLESDSRE